MNSEFRLTDAERHQMLEEWNATATDYPRDVCIHELFEQQAAQTPQAVALFHAGVEVSYEELNGRANRLAHRLVDSGVAADVLVGVCAGRSIEMVVGLLAVLKAGGAYVPLDPGYPSARLSYMLADAAPTVLLTESSLVDDLPPYDGEVLCLDEFDWSGKERRENLGVEVGATNLAYVIYTSGSTGRPKGTCIEHRSVVRLVKETNYIELTATDVVAQVSSCSFDAATFEVWGSLLNGAKLVMVDKEEALSPPLLAESIDRHSITTMFVTTALFNTLAEVAPGVLGRLRNLLFGGESVTPHWVRKVLSEGAPERLLHVYGPTETTTYATWYLVTEVAEDVRTVPIGRPIANSQCYVLDEHSQPVPIGVTGELYIGGDGLSRGYLNQPELTKEKFVDNPFGEGRLYRTGDKVRYLADGDIEFVGRIDDQVKLRGFRIELSEIESVLREHNGVKDAVVLLREDSPGDKRLVAYVVPAADNENLHEQLRQWLSSNLPDYMMPAAFVALTEMPINTNGKVDRDALHGMNVEVAANAYNQPQTEQEIELADIWADVLTVAQIGRDNNFFDLGGHSLLATRVISQIRERMSVEITFKNFHDFPVLTELAAFIVSQTNLQDGVDEFQIPVSSRESSLPLSYSQERVWFIEQVNPGNTAYHFQSALRFKGPLSIPALEASLAEIVQRHEIFRTTFISENGKPVQKIYDDGQIALTVENVDLDNPEFERLVRRRLWEESRQPFDLTRLPLLRWVLLSSGDEHALVHVEHHIIHDGWSFNIFLADLIELYNASAKGVSSRLAEPEIQFADFAMWQRNWMQLEEADRQRSYWKNKLEGAPRLLELPLDRVRPAQQSYQGAAIRHVLPSDLGDRISSVCKSQRVSPFVVLLTAFFMTLRSYSGQNDFCIGTGFANRRSGQVEQLVGMIINNLVMRVRFSKQSTARDLLMQLQQNVLEASSNQDLPFDQVVDVLRPERDASYNPLFQVMFGLHDAPMPTTEFTGLTCKLDLGIGNGSAKFDLNVVIFPSSSQGLGNAVDPADRSLVFSWEYNTDLFKAETIERMLNHYERLLEAVVRDPDCRISALDMLSPAERHQMLEEWNATATDYPRDVCIHELFEQQAAQTPQAVALFHAGVEVSYEELNGRANRLAHRLVDSGVAADVLVGVCAGRSIEMVVGLLAVLKAGGAYVPLDPGYPSARLSYMLADAAPTVLLTESSLVDDLPPYDGEVLCLDEFDWSGKERRENLGVEVGATNLAYVIYTSGSTGRPKGTCIEHRSVVRLVKETNYIELTATDVVAQVSSCSFDAATFEVWGSLLNGAKLVMVDKEEALSPPLLAESIDRHSITTMFVTTALFNTLAEVAPGVLGRLRNLLFGGESVTPHWVRKVLSEGAPERLLHVYGPTETTTYATWYLVTEVAEDVRTVPIGRPIANSQCYVLDEHSQPVPIGVTGELYIGGDGLSRGYLNQPELTKEKFVDNPFGEGRLYRTGDKVRYLADGDIEFVGRIDDQVKLRGFRIELSEIESVLREHNGVKDAVVLLREDSPGDKRLVAYVVPAADNENLHEQLRQWLSSNLPDYMMPAAFVALTEMPINANGKVDRHALPAPEKTDTLNQTDYVAPRTPTEEALAEIWQVLLECEQIGIHDNFFDLGGHSLLMTQLQSRLRDHFDFDMAMRDLFAIRTVSQLAGRIDSSRNADDDLTPDRERGVL